MNIILDTKSRIYKQTIIKDKQNSNDRTFGFAVKLSVLKKYDISINSILENTYQEIVIDAEYNRLDHWLMNQLDLGNILLNDLNRLLITVQAKRIDARDQLINLRKLNVSVILVAGHSEYLKDDEKKNSGVFQIANFYQEFSNIRYLGISANAHKKLNQILDLQIQDDKILELYGAHKLTQSSLWIYWVGTEISDEARLYINRRKHNGENLSFIKIKGIYCIQSTAQLEEYSTSRSIYTYMDVIGKTEFINSIKEISK